MSKLLLVLLLQVLLQNKNCNAYKIFVYSSQISFSHVSFMGHIADTLAEVGHNVTVFLPEFNENVTLTGVKLAKAIVNPRRYHLGYTIDETMSDVWTEQGSDPTQMFKILRMVSNFTANLCDQQLGETKIIEEFRNEKFDLGIGEVFDPCAIAFINMINISSYISVFSTNIIEAFATPFGIDSNPSYVPSSLSPLTDEMTYFERAQNFAISVLTEILFRLINKPMFENVLYKYFPRDYDRDEALSRSSFVFVNSEEFTEFPRPITHKFIFIGGIGVKKPKKLTKEFQTVMDNASEGVILVSFGSAVKSTKMPIQMKQAFLGAFPNFPKITFIWKYEEDDKIGNNIPNLYKTKWVPQNDLFGHPKLLAFISHGGMNSVTESTHAGIPMVMIPLFGDQMRNSKMAQKRGVAYVLNKKNITSQSLSDALKAVIYDKRYRESANRLSLMINKKPISAKEKVIKYSEFAAQFGQIDNLNLASVKLNFIQYYLIDIIIPALLLLIIIFYFSFKFTLFIFRKFSKIFKSKID